MIQESWSFKTRMWECFFWCLVVGFIHSFCIKYSHFQIKSPSASDVITDYQHSFTFKATVRDELNHLPFFKMLRLIPLSEGYLPTSAARNQAFIWSRPPLFLQYGLSLAWLCFNVRKYSNKQLRVIRSMCCCVCFRCSRFCSFNKKCHDMDVSLEHTLAHVTSCFKPVKLPELFAGQSCFWIRLVSVVFSFQIHSCVCFLLNSCPEQLVDIKLNSDEMSHNSFMC